MWGEPVNASQTAITNDDTISSLTTTTSTSSTVIANSITPSIPSSSSSSSNRSRNNPNANHSKRKSGSAATTPASPFRIRSLDNVQSVSCGQSFAVARLQTGEIVWWGSLIGQSATPQLLMIPVEATLLACTQHAVVVSNGKTVYVLPTSTKTLIPTAFDTLYHKEIRPFIIPSMFWIQCQGLPADDPIVRLSGGGSRVAAVTKSGQLYMCDLPFRGSTATEWSKFNSTELVFVRCLELGDRPCVDVAIGDSLCLAIAPFEENPEEPVQQLTSVAAEVVQ
jgi:hypothetical protein